MAIRRYPGTNNDLVQQLLAMKNEAQVRGIVNPDYAPLVQASMAGAREADYKDKMLGLQEKGLTLAQQKETAQQNQFAQSLALHKEIMGNEISAADRARMMGWGNMALGAGLTGAYLYGYDPSKRRF
jgi:hypothetical protein